MQLQFLIPQYEETDQIVKPILDSIAIQQNVDFSEIGVIICNDGSNVFLSENLLNNYPFEIEYHKEPHRGVSSTRNTALDYATADYVMFCDADDMFYSVCGLWMLFKEMEIGFDSLVSCFIEETRVSEDVSLNIQAGQPAMKKGDVLYINHDMDSTFVHGKVHRRQYLIEQNIRFNDSLTIHEDSFFNILAQNLSENVKYCPTPFYLCLVDEFIRRSRQDKAAFYCAFMIFDAYYTMNKPEWINQENREYRDLTERRFSEYYIKHKSLWDSIPTPDKMMISNGVRTRSVNEGMLMEAITIEDWLKRMETLI